MGKQKPKVKVNVFDVTTAVNDLGDTLTVDFNED